MKAVVKLILASFTLTTALAAAVPAAVQMPGPDLNDEMGRACYNAGGLIVPCRPAKPKY